MIVVHQKSETSEFACLDDFIDGGMPPLVAVMARAEVPPAISMQPVDDVTWRIYVAFPEHAHATECLAAVHILFCDQYSMDCVYRWLRRIEVACLRAAQVGMPIREMIELLESHNVLVDAIDAGAVRQWICAIEVLDALGHFPGDSSARRREQMVAALVRELYAFSPPMQTVCMVLARWETSLRESDATRTSRTALRASLVEDLFDERSGPVNDVLGEELDPLGI